MRGRVLVLILAARAGLISAGEVNLAPYSPGEPCRLTGGYEPPRKPQRWEDQRYLEITPAMTILEGNIMAVEGFVFPEPAATLSNLGGFHVPGMAGKGKLKGNATALRAVFSYGDGTEVHLNRVCPGLLLKTGSPRVELFTSRHIPTAAWRVTGKRSRPPACLAFSEAGVIRVLKAEGEVSLARMDEPWIVAWWGGKGEFEIPLRPAGGGRGRSIWPVYPARTNLRLGTGVGEWPVLIVLEKRCERVEASADGWRLHFGRPAGRIIVAPLYGRRWVKAEEIAGWSKALPADVVQQARDWTARLRSIPVDVRESQGIVDGVVTITDAFTYEEIEDDWKTPPRPWAPVPPVFALARAMGFPIEAAGARRIRDWNWLHRLGPVAGLDGASEITYRIETGRLQDYLWKPQESRAPKGGGRRYELLRGQLGAEIEKVLAAGHLSPHQWTFGEMSAGYYDTAYFFNPGETLTALCWALPHLEKGQAEKLKAYIRREFREYSPFEDRWWGGAGERKGALRERYPVDAQAGHWVKGTNFNLQNLYAAWLYADRVGGPDELARVWKDAKAYLDRHIGRARVEWDYTERVRFPVQHPRHHEHLGHRNHPSVEMRHESANSRVNGLFGFARLARMAGDARAEEVGTCLLARSLALRFAQVHFDQYLIERGLHDAEPFPAPLADDRRRLQSLTLMRGLYVGPRLAWTYIWKENRPASEKGIGGRIFYFHVNHPVWTSGQAGGGLSGGRDVIDTPLFFIGLDLTPEAARFYRDYCLDFVELASRRLDLTAPTWFMADGHTYWSSEESVAPPEVSWACFLAKALVLRPGGHALYDWVDFPQAAFGDIYYLQKLVFALRAFY